MAEGDAGKDAGEDAGKGQPSLELPKLSWRRKARPEAHARPEPAAPPPAGESPAPPDREVAPPLFVDEVDGTDEPTLVEETRPVPAPVAVEEPVRAPVEPAEPARRAPRVRRPGGMVAAFLTGVVVGLGMVGLTWASLRLCESVQGTSSCGGAGYGLLTAILVLMVVVGALLLKAARVPEAASTSFLAVGLTAVIALLFLVDSLLDRPMVVVIPVITAVAFVAAHWVTRTFVEPPRD